MSPYSENRLLLRLFIKILYFILDYLIIQFQQSIELVRVKYLKPYTIEATLMLNWILGNNNLASPYQITGAYSFKVQVQPKHTPETNSNIVITCHSSRNPNDVVPVRVVWFRTKNGVTAVINSVRGNTYMCQPADLGASIKAQATVTNTINNLYQYERGVAVVEFKPVQMDVVTKNSLQNLLSSGWGQVSISMQSHVGEERRCLLYICDSFIRLKDCLTENCFKFEYQVGDPRVQQDSRDCTKLHLRFSQRYQIDLIRYLQSVSSIITENRRIGNQVKVQLRFSTRATRDLFVFARKAFLGKRQSRTAFLLSRLDQSDFFEDKNLIQTIKVQQLRDDIARMAQSQLETAKEKEFYIKEVGRLEEEMETMVTTYTRIVEDKCRNQIELNRSYSVLTSKRDEIVAKKKGEPIENKQYFLNKIQALTAEIEFLRMNSRTHSHEQISMASTPAINNNQVLYTSTVNGGTKPGNAFIKKASNGIQIGAGFNYEILEAKLQDLSRINNQLTEQNSRLKLHGSRVQNNSILDSLYQSAVRQPEHDHLKKEKELLMQQLQVSTRRILQLERVVKQNSRVIMGVAPNNQEINKLTRELQEIRRQNESLLQENYRLNNMRSQDIASCQVLQNQILKLKEQLSHSSLMSSRVLFGQLDSKIRTQSNQDAGEIKRLRQQRDQLRAAKHQLEVQIDHMAKECSELRIRISGYQSQISLLRGCPPTSQQSKLLKGQLQQLKQQLLQKQNLIKFLEHQLRQSEERHRRKYEDLKEENRTLSRGQEMLNRSRDLSMELENYFQEESNVMKAQLNMLSQENDRLAKMCEKFSKEVRELSKFRAQVVQLRQENTALRTQLSMQGLTAGS